MGQIWCQKSAGIGIETIWYRKKVSVLVSFNILGTVTHWWVSISTSMYLGHTLTLDDPIKEKRGSGHRCVCTHIKSIYQPDRDQTYRCSTGGIVSIHSPTDKLPAFENQTNTAPQRLTLKTPFWWGWPSHKQGSMVTNVRFPGNLVPSVLPLGSSKTLTHKFCKV